MSEVVVGLLGFACIVAIVVTLFKSKTLPSIAFIIFPMILGAILVFGGYYSWENIGKLIFQHRSNSGTVRIQRSVLRYHDRCRNV
jgi:Mg2+/citrate symporter